MDDHTVVTWLVVRACNLCGFIESSFVSPDDWQPIRYKTYGGDDCPQCADGNLQWYAIEVNLVIPLGPLKAASNKPPWRTT